jgi:hypothetical protein
MSTRTKEKWSAAFVGGGLLLAVFACWLGARHILDGWMEPGRAAHAPGEVNHFVQVAIGLLVVSGLAVFAGLVIAAAAYATKRAAERLSRFTVTMLAGLATIAVSLVVVPVVVGTPSDAWVEVLVAGTAIGTVIALAGAIGVLAGRTTIRVDDLVASAPSSV